jgi:hypothetical protein
MILRNGFGGIRACVDSYKPHLSIVYGKTCHITGVIEQILFVALGFGPTLAAMQAAWKIANRN